MKDHSYGVVPFMREGDKILFLVIHQTKGHWGFPKGHAESGESAEQAARREFNEETGVNRFSLIPNVSFDESYFFKLGGETINKTVTFFIAEVTNPEVKVQEKEVEGYKWVGFEDALGVLTYEGSREVLREVNDFIRDLNSK